MSVLHPHSVVIIGAGPAGLAAATCLKQHKIPLVILEKSNQIAPKWKEHYDRLHLHTHKDYSYLPGMKFPKETPVFPSRDQVWDYLKSYANHFKHMPIFKTTVQSIRKEKYLWHIKTDDAELKAKHVIIATGRNCEPKETSLEVLKDYSGKVLHSCHYKNGSSFKDKKVLVVGAGNTGAEIALDLLEHGAKPSWCVRSPTYVAPLHAFGSATQVTNIRMSRFPMSLTDPITKFFLKLKIGDLSSYGIEGPKAGPREHMLGKGQTPIIDIGTIAAVKEGKIKVVKEIEKTKVLTVFFKNGNEEKFDAIVLATGYKTGLEKILEDSDRYLDEDGLPNKDIDFVERNRIYFLGIREKGTGVFYEINKDSQRIADKIAEDLKKV